MLKVIYWNNKLRIAWIVIVSLFLSVGTFIAALVGIKFVGSNSSLNIDNDNAILIKNLIGFLSISIYLLVWFLVVSGTFKALFFLFVDFRAKKQGWKISGIILATLMFSAFLVSTVFFIHFFVDWVIFVSKTNFGSGFAQKLSDYFMAKISINNFYFLTFAISFIVWGLLGLIYNANKLIFLGKGEMISYKVYSEEELNENDEVVISEETIKEKTKSKKMKKAMVDKEIQSEVEEQVVEQTKANEQTLTTTISQEQTTSQTQTKADDFDDWLSQDASQSSLSQTSSSTTTASADDAYSIFD